MSSDIPELDAERFVRLSKNAPEGSTLKFNADLSLEIHIPEVDGMTSIYLGPAPDSMSWSDYQNFLRTMGVWE